MQVLTVLDEYFPEDGLYFELFVSKINSYATRNWAKAILEAGCIKKLLSRFLTNV